MAQYCKDCGERIHAERFMGKDFWIDDTGGDVCTGDQMGRNEDGEHFPFDFNVVVVPASETEEV